MLNTESARRASGSGSSAAGAHRQYYVAVGSGNIKLATLVDLLLAIQAGGAVSLIVHCGARDSLDDVAAGLATLPDTSVTCLHADQGDAERDAAVVTFCHRVRPSEAGGSGAAEMEPSSPAVTVEPAADGEAVAASPPEEISGPAAHVLVATDAGLRALETRGAPPPPPLLLHYDLPTRKDIFSRRAAVANRARSPGGRPAIVVYFVTAGQVGDFRVVEGHAGGSAAIEEMPVHVAELFGR